MRTLLAFVAACAVFARIAGEAAGYYAEQRVLSKLREYGVSIQVANDVSWAKGGAPWANVQIASFC